jgi:hypothetical protein
MGTSTIAAPNQVATQPQTAQTDCYRLMLLNSEGTDVLLQRANNKYALPEVRIPRFMRPADQITSLLRDTWGIPTVLLFSSHIESAPGRPHYAMVEACERGWQVPPDFAWVPIQQATSYLVDCDETSLLQSSHAKAVQPYFGVDPAPFSRLGWIHKLYDWVKVAVAPLGIEPTGVSQLNGSETFSLLRFDTTKEPLWFKAVGKPNLHEFPITMTLSNLFPGYVPNIVASDPLLNGWLMEHGGNYTLRDIEQLKTWRSAIQRLVDLQIESIPRVATLLEAGCRDLRVETLAILVAPFFNAMIGIMQQQTKSSPPPLTPTELSGLACMVSESLSLIRDVNIPDALGHGDFNPGNILNDGEHSVFTDWAEAHVSHPFVTFEYFLIHLRRCRPSLVAQEHCLREAYARRWLPFASRVHIDRCLRFCPVIAAYVHAVSNKARYDAEMLAAPGSLAYLRSLTRSMKREADLLSSRGNT